MTTSRAVALPAARDHKRQLDGDDQDVTARPSQQEVVRQHQGGWIGIADIFGSKDHHAPGYEFYILRSR